MEPKQGQAQQMPQQAVPPLDQEVLVPLVEITFGLYLEHAVPPQDQEVLVSLAEISFAPFLEQDRFHPESIPRQPQLHRIPLVKRQAAPNWQYNLKRIASGSPKDMPLPLLPIRRQAGPSPWSTAKRIHMGRPPITHLCSSPVKGVATPRHQAKDKRLHCSTPRRLQRWPLDSHSPPKQGQGPAKEMYLVMQCLHQMTVRSSILQWPNCRTH